MQVSIPESRNFVSSSIECLRPPEHTSQVQVLARLLSQVKAAVPCTMVHFYWDRVSLADEFQTMLMHQKHFNVYLVNTLTPPTFNILIL